MDLTGQSRISEQRTVKPLREPMQLRTDELVEDERELKDLKAVAIGVDEEGDPKLIAVGYGEYAEKIIRKAKEAGVHIERDPQLVDKLSKVKLGGDIPEELFDVVSALIYYVWKLDERFSAKLKRLQKRRG